MTATTKQKKGEEQPKFGLLKTPEDSRDFQLGAVFSLPKLETLPESMKFSSTIKHQGGSDFCSAFMTTTMSEFQEKVELSPEWSFAKSKEISGNVDGWGQDMRSACKTHVKHGALPQEKAKYSVETNDSKFLRDIKNWGKVNEVITALHKKKSFFKVTGQYDHFDNIRATLFKFECPVGIGVDFSWNLKDKVLDTIGSGFGHAMTVTGYNDKHLIVQNSYGKESGDQGYHYITREVINHFVEKYGAYCFIDLPPETAKEHMEYGTKEDGWWFINIWRSLLNAIFK